MRLGHVAEPVPQLRPPCNFPLDLLLRTTVNREQCGDRPRIRVIDVLEPLDQRHP